MTSWHNGEYRRTVRTSYTYRLSGATKLHFNWFTQKIFNRNRNSSRVQWCVKYLLRINAFNCHNKPRNGRVLYHFMDEQTKAQRGWETCLKPHSSDGGWVGGGGSRCSSLKKGGARVSASLRQHHGGCLLGNGVSEIEMLRGGISNVGSGEAWCDRQPWRKLKVTEMSWESGASLTWLERVVRSSLWYLISWVPYPCISG